MDPDSSTISSDGWLAQLLDTVELLFELVPSSIELWMLEWDGSGHVPLRPGITEFDLEDAWVWHDEDDESDES